MGGVSRYRPPPSGALAEMMARDAEREGEPFGGYAGERLPPPEASPPPLPRPLIPPPPWSRPEFVEDTEAYPAKRRRLKGD